MDHVDRTELLRRLGAEYTRFRGVLATLRPERLDEPGCLGAWTAKDLVVHLIAHEQRALAELRHALVGDQLAIDHAAGDAFNDGGVKACRPLAAAAVLAAWEASFQEVVAVVSRLTEADFDPHGSVCAALGDTVDGALGNNTYGHYAEHLPALTTFVAAERRAEDA